MTTSRSAGKKSGKPRGYHHGNLREELLTLALAKVEVEGAEALSLNALAKELGVSQPAPYRHFVDRSALLAAVAEQGFRDFSSTLQGAIDGKPRMQHVGLLAHAYVAFARARVNLYRLMFCSRIVATHPQEASLQQAADEGFGMLLGALGGDGSQGRAFRVAFTAWSGLHGLVLLEQEGFLADPGVDANDLIEDLIAAVRQSMKR